MSDIATLLREEGWELPTYNIGEYECKCPYCSHLRKAHHRNNKCAKVWIEDTDFATYSCLNCGKHGFVKAQNTDSKKTSRYVKPTIPEKRNLSHADAFLESRGISIATASKMSLYDEKNALGVDLICFPFYKGGQIVNVKRRGIKEKMFFQEKNPEPVVYNYDGAFNALKEHNNTLIICEGEVDCLTFVEAGYDNCVSLPAGSDPQIRDKGYTGSRFDFLKASKPLLDSAQHIILALDADEPGQAMTQSLINMLPHEKLLTVDWSAYSVPGKDANDFWRQDKSIIKDAIDRAQPVEISKITPLIDNPRDLESYLIDGIQGGIQTGFPRLDDFVTFLPGDFVSITGYPGSGKSTWVMGALLNMARYDNLKCLYCAFENPKKQVAAKLLQMLIGEPVFGAGEDVVKRCQPLYPFLNEHFKVLDDNSEVLKLDALLNNIKNSIVNDGINVVVIDPFNKIEYARTKDTTGDIGAVLNKLISFTHRHNVLMFLVAHPTKPENRKIGGQDIPTGFDIAGSANFQNMSDAVISVHRKQDADGQKSNTVRVTVTKWRFGERGREGSAYFRYNSRSATYTEATKEEFDAEAKTARERIELK